MKKKKLTINSLAGSNLKNRKKQYSIMIAGIILAMVFSSSVIISLFSLSASILEMGRKDIGIQDAIMLNVTEEFMKEAKKDGYVEEYGYAHMVGYASNDSGDKNKNGFYMAWLDDTAKKLSYQYFIEGAYPANENEIAVAQEALARLGIEAKIGEEISLEVFPQNGISHIWKSNQKTYKLVGIVKEKISCISHIVKSPFLRNIPSAFVCEGTDTDAGGKESLVSYLTFTDFDYPEMIQEDDDWIVNDECHEFGRYIKEKYNISDSVNESVNQKFMMLNANLRWYYPDSYSLETLIVYAGIIGIVLALTSCIAIVNSFNSNIKERKQQIGMLRAVGATKRQIVNMLSREVLIISLLSIPISLVISYLLVLALSNLFGEDFVLKVDMISIAACGAIGLLTVMLAALIPILHATRITPMQAIRDVEVARKMKIKKIKSQNEFAVPKLLAKRSMAFYKGNQIAVSILLVSTILLSCFGFSYVSYEKAHPYKAGYDYSVNTYYPGSISIMNFSEKSGGLSDAEKQNISAAPYISRAFGVKSCMINVLIDEYTDYFKILSAPSLYPMRYQLDDYNGSNYAEIAYSIMNDSYSSEKSELGFTKDFFSTTLYAVDDWKLEELEDHLVSGEINLDKLASGEEIILIAPRKTAVCVIPFDNGDLDYYEVTLIDEQIDNKVDYDVYGEFEYKAGDTLDLSLIFGSSDDTNNMSNCEKVDKTVKIGAVISPEYFSSSATDQWIMQSEKFGVLTSIAGMNRFSQNEKYKSVYLFADGEINDEINEDVTTYVDSILYKYKRNVDSAYEANKSREEQNNAMLVAMISLIVIGFAVCASLTNNAFTASICERKRELGTLRAVGISRKEFVESYVRQLLKTFAVGYGVGFGIFVLIYSIISIIVCFLNQGVRHYVQAVKIGFSFNPWITIIFCIILFAVCSINLWLKIRKEMKNSIIDNIREL